MGAGSGLFVYGTLLRCFDHPLNRSLLRYADGVDKACARGQLYDLGNYPGLVPLSFGGHQVVGEFYRLSKLDTLLGQLDEYEGFDPAMPSASLFARKRLTVSVYGGSAHRSRTAPAWVYVLNRISPNARKIVSGDYQAFRHGAAGNRNSKTTSCTQTALPRDSD